MKTNEKVRSRTRRHRRVRKKVVGTPERPRLAVFRSNRHIYAQVIDDFAGRTIASSSSLATKDGDDPIANAKEVGRALAARAKDAGVTAVAFDRGGFMYHGRVKALADGARDGGLEF
ncbi:MAG TPA: 50S ribosomal protein L18 [Actinomycetota bacterium]|jgi:large subunit ribosomal protein L18